MRLFAALLTGLAGGVIIANPEPFIEVATLVLPFIILSLYITVALRLKRGLSSHELALLTLLIAGGTGYLIGQQEYARSIIFALTTGTPVALSVFLHALLRKHHDAEILRQIRKTRIYQILQTEVKL
jgi:hypothetical protein